MSVSWVLRRSFGPSRKDVIRRQKRLFNEALHTLYSSPDFTGVIRSIKIGRRVMWHALDRRKRHTWSG